MEISSFTQKKIMSANPNHAWVAVGWKGLLSYWKLFFLNWPESHGRWRVVKHNIPYSCGHFCTSYQNLFVVWYVAEGQLSISKIKRLKCVYVCVCKAPIQREFYEAFRGFAPAVGLHKASMSFGHKRGGFIHFTRDSVGEVYYRALWSFYGHMWPHYITLQSL